MSQTVHTHAVTVTFADKFEPRTKVRKCTLAEGQSATEWAKGHFVRPVKSAKAVVLAPAPAQEAKPVAASKPVSKPAPVSTRATKAELLARIAELEAGIAPKDPEAPSAPARKPRVTQTRAERKASTAKRKAADAKPATMHRHDAAMSNPTYANAYNAALDGTDGKSKASHVTATMRAWKALEAETLSKATRKAHKARKAA